MHPVVLIATLTLKAGNVEDVFQALKTLHQKTHEEDKGCLQYDVHKDTERENTYVFIETWESEALLEEHMQKDHFKAFRAFMNDKVENSSHKLLQKIL